MNFTLGYCAQSHQMFFEISWVKTATWWRAQWRHLFSFNQIFPLPSRLIRFFVFLSRFPSLALLPSTSINDYDLTFVQCQHLSKAFCLSFKRETLTPMWRQTEVNFVNIFSFHSKVQRWKEIWQMENQRVEIKGPFLLNYGSKSTLKIFHFPLYKKIFSCCKTESNLGIKLFILICVRMSLKKRFTQKSFEKIFEWFH